MHIKIWLYLTCLNVSIFRLKQEYVIYADIRNAVSLLILSHLFSRLKVSSRVINYTRRPEYGFAQTAAQLLRCYNLFIPLCCKNFSVSDRFILLNNSRFSLHFGWLWVSRELLSCALCIFPPRLPQESFRRLHKTPGDSHFTAAIKVAQPCLFSNKPVLMTACGWSANAQGSIKYVVANKIWICGQFCFYRYGDYDYINTISLSNLTETRIIIKIQQWLIYLGTNYFIEKMKRLVKNFIALY